MNVRIARGLKGAVPMLLCALLLVAQPGLAARAKIETVAADPYRSALAIDADSGTILVEDNIDAVAYPASVLKLMVLKVILDRIAEGSLKLDEMVQVTKEASQMGGSQVYLDPKEQFSVEDLLYALIIQSANDAAVALATHVAGSKEGFIELMNRKAAELGMSATAFHSVHGLPPAEGQEVDRTTARDLAVLARELARNPEVFKFTGTTERGFRNNEFIMRTHNKLLATVDGCDGFKTGYFEAAGFSIVATARRAGVRIIVVVLGSADRKVRDAKAAELIATGFAKVGPRPQAVAAAPAAAPAPAPVVAVPAAPAAESGEGEVSRLGRDLMMVAIGFAAGLLVWLVAVLLRSGGRPGRRRLL